MSISQQLLNDPHHWHARAAEARAMAGTFGSDAAGAQARMLQIAVSYDQIAANAEMLSVRTLGAQVKKMTSLKRNKKSAEELLDLVSARMGVGRILIGVHKNPIYGWDAKLMVAPTQLIDVQKRLLGVVVELRALYDLEN